MTNYENAGIPVVSIKLVCEPSPFAGKTIEDVGDAIGFIREVIGDCDRELFCVVNLKSNGSVINYNMVSMGTLHSTLISPREVFKSSILSNAAAIVAFHNHPSGNLEPSYEDRMITERLIFSGNILDIPLADHIIVGPGTDEYYSFKEHKELEKSLSQEVKKETIVHER